MAEKTWYPIADSGTVNFDGSDGNQVDNYALIDEVSANDADYLIAPVGTNSTDYYDHTDDPVPDGSTGISITVYYRFGFFGNPASPESGQISAGINSNGTDGLDTYNLGKNVAVAPDSVTFNTNPDGNGAWTPATINAIKLAASGISRFQVGSQITQLYAVVTYTEGTPSATDNAIFFGTNM